MSINNEKKDSGLSVMIERPIPDPKPAPAKRLETIHDVDSQYSVSPVTTRSAAPISDASNPFSPFYDHSEAPTTLSLPVEPPISKASTRVYESDLEAGFVDADKKLSSQSKDCTVWPGQKTLKDAKKREKRRGECWNPMRGLDKKTRLILKLLIAAVIVGAAVGIGLGISRAVGGGIWNPDSGNTKRSLL